MPQLKGHVKNISRRHDVSVESIFSNTCLFLEHLGHRADHADAACQRDVTLSAKTDPSKPIGPCCQQIHVAQRVRVTPGARPALTCANVYNFRTADWSATVTSQRWVSPAEGNHFYMCFGLCLLNSSHNFTLADCNHSFIIC